jgi:Holliday junction resolvase RusA-like endonuclease
MTIPMEERQEVLRGLVDTANRIAGLGFDDDPWDVGPVFVKGTPATQGSKRAFVNRYTGKPSLKESSKGLPGWRNDIRAAFAPLMDGRELLDGPLEVRVRFVFLRPQHHHVAGDRSRPVKPNAPVYHAQAPDLSKLLRGMEDDLNGLVWTDDSRIARYVDPVKVWGSQPGMELAIRRIRA